jgi:hypothetical protein
MSAYKIHTPGNYPEESIRQHLNNLLPNLKDFKIKNECEVLHTGRE